MPEDYSVLLHAVVLQADITQDLTFFGCLQLVYVCMYVCMYARSPSTGIWPVSRPQPTQNKHKHKENLDKLSYPGWSLNL